MLTRHGARGRDVRQGERNGSAKRHPDRGDRGRGGGGGNGGGEIVSRMRQGASGALQSVMQSAQSVSQQIKETTGEVTGAVVETLLDEADRIYRKQKKPALSRISNLTKIADRTAHALHAVKADGVAEYVQQAAEQVDGITEYLDDRSLDEILEDAGEIVQKNRAVAMGGMFVVAFAVARFLKASASRDEAEDGGGGDDDDTGEDDDEQRDAARAPRKKRRKQ